MDGSEKRKSPRFPLILQVGYRGNADPIIDCTENLSAGGLFIRTEMKFEVGNVVPLILSFPGLLHPLELEVQVVRRRPTRGSEPGGVAVKLRDDDDEGKVKLHRLALAAAGKSSPDTPRQFRLILAEDNQLLAQMYATALEKVPRSTIEQLQCDFATTGEEAWSLMLRNPAPNLLITDLVMPLLDGAGLLKRAQANPATKDIPVLIITSSELSLDERHRLTRLGARAFLNKPIKLAEIIETVRSLMHLPPK
jgi:uncharacterized protein (TIGR02266 family)